MAQHPTPPPRTVTITRTVTPGATAAALPPRQPERQTETKGPDLSPAVRLAVQRQADLRASVREIGPSQTAGIVSGPGNQGTACTAIMVGHAGTGADAKSVPRNMKGGGVGIKP